MSQSTPISDDDGEEGECLNIDILRRRRRRSYCISESNKCSGVCSFFRPLSPADLLWKQCVCEENTEVTTTSATAIFGSRFHCYCRTLVVVVVVVKAKKVSI